MTYTVFGAKTLDFLKFMMCRRREIWDSADILWTRGEGHQFFTLLCGRLLYGQPLSLLHKLILNSPILTQLSWKTIYI